MSRLDARESGGFVKQRAAFHFAEASRAPVSAIIYVAPPDNPNFLGEASLDEIVRQVRAAHGRSGSNLEYVLRLSESLRELGAEDEEVLRVAGRLRATV
jgi:cation transport regulator ChaC